MEKCPRQADELKITSNAGDAEYPDHDDALVVTVYIADARVRRVVVDTRSSVNVLYLDGFQKLKLTIIDLSPMSSTLTGFMGDSITPLRMTILPITHRQEPRSKTMMVTFMVDGSANVERFGVGLGLKVHDDQIHKRMIRFEFRD
ncbi:hypothetical protein BHM03_00035833 [Ensete ventricosum]|uniref:Uncharacterized protein n=1 Tax=Ensete ventricosum TaxID=4639 RepID=A0A445MJC5_ENSVE|nr:hypothetical protein BHM03_00035833 [Ensete ventricosum]